MIARTLVAGIDSSTQSCKVVIRDAVTAELVRSGSAPHPAGTSVHPDVWWDALLAASRAAGGFDDVAAVAVGGQQHGMVCLDADGVVVRDALLWNDTRSAQAALDLIDELPAGAKGWAEASGAVPVASFTITKLRWLAEHEPAHARRVAAVCLPHDWLTWRLRGAPGIAELTTDRGDASGTGYWSPARGCYRRDLLQLAFGAEPLLPEVLGPKASPGVTAAPGLSVGAVVGPGTGDNAAAALGVGAARGDMVVSIGTSGVVSGVSATPTADETGIVAGFADATGSYLPLVCTLNAAQVLDATARLLGVDLAELSRLALTAPSGAEGLVLVPYLNGERTPNRPDATGALHGLTGRTATPAHIARAAIEGLLCGLADGVDALRAQQVEVGRAVLVGGGARSEAVRQLASGVLGVPVDVPRPGEYVADGAARQAAWVLSGDAAPPPWERSGGKRFASTPVPSVRRRYAEVCEMTAVRLV